MVDSSGCFPKTPVLAQSGILIAKDGDIMCLYSMWEDTGLIYKRRKLNKPTQPSFRHYKDFHT